MHKISNNPVQAQRHLQTEERNDADGSNDLLSSLISNSGIGGDEFSSPQNDNFDTQSTVGTEPKPSFSGNHDVIPPPLQLTVESIAATEALELSSATVKIKKLETEAAQNRQKMLLLENALSTGTSIIKMVISL